MPRKLTFALFFANRGFFPGELIASAREEMQSAVRAAGFDCIAMAAEATRFGAVETMEEGRKYAAFLDENRGKFDGVILCLPNFGDENGASVALADAGVPILIQAYPDEPGEMDFAHRRDALCGKLAICNVFRQCGIKFSLTRQFTVHPLSQDFRRDLQEFGAVCRVTGGFKDFHVGAIGARTTAFKTVRFDEIALQNKGIHVETVDLSEVFARMEGADATAVARKKKHFRELADFGKYPEEKIQNLAAFGVVMDELIGELKLSALAIRCWDEIERKYGIAPCLVLGDLNERGIAASCELDVNNAVMMRGMSLASEHPVMLLDVNNNYGSDPGCCILFHCGPAPASMMQERGEIREHLMFRKAYGEGSGVGVNIGKLYEGKATVGSFKTEGGQLWAFATEGNLEEGDIEQAFFGVKTVFRKENLEEMLRYMALNGYRHHVAVARGNWAAPLSEAFGKYLDIRTEII